MENFAKFLAVLVVVPLILLGFFLVLGTVVDFGQIAQPFDRAANQSAAGNQALSEAGGSEIRKPNGGAVASNERIVTVKDTTFTVEVADTPAKRRQGLSDRDPLPSNHGMLFIFDTSDRHGIWMKDMRFAIDIIWLNEDKRAVDIEENVKPETYPEIFYPRKEALYVIEVPKGFVDRNNVEINDFFVFTVPPPAR